VWREVNGEERLAAQVINGRPTRFSVDEYSPLVVWDRVPWWRSNAWLKPAAQIAFLILLLALARWPARAVMRLRFGLAVARLAAPLGIDLGLTFCALVGVIVPSIWLRTIAPIMTFTADPKTIDLQVISASLLTLIGYAGGLLLALVNGWFAWKNGTWVSRLWAVLLILSFGVALWIAWIFKLLSFSTSF